VNTLELPRDAAGKTAEDYLRELAANDAPARFRVMSAAEFLEVPTTAEENKARIARYKAQDAAHYARVAPGENDLEIEAVAQRTRPPAYQKLTSLLAKRTQVEWLLRDTLEAGVIALVVGGKGTYKSTLINDWAMRVALSGKPVFVLSPEGSGLQRRLQGWLEEYAPLTDADTLPLYVRDRRLNISAATELDALLAWLDEIEQIEGQPIALCAIDTWSKATGHDEDNNTETKKLIGEIDRRLRHRGNKRCTVCIAHHTGHGDQSRGRGASALGADTDAEYIVSKTKENTIKVTRERFKDSPSLPPLYFAPKILDLGYKDTEGYAATSVVLEPASAPDRGAPLTKQQCELRDRVLELGAKATEEKIIEGMDGRPGDLKRRLNKMVGSSLTLSKGVYSVAATVMEIEDFES
jgi:hypothetical protein